MSDYATELLGKDSALDSRLGYSSPQTDYATDILASKATDRNKPTVRDIDQLPIANKGSNDQTVGFSTTVKGKMVEDPKTRLRIYAKDLFPDLPEQEALSRVGMVGDDIVYLGMDDKLYRAKPEGFGADVKSLAASATASSPSLVLGAIGAVGGSEVPVVGNILGAAIGAAGGKGIERSVANLAFDEPQTWQGNLRDMTVEGMFGAGGAIGGKALSGFLQRNAARDIQKIDPNKVKELQAKSTALGISLTPAEITNLPSLKSQQKVLAGIPSSADVMDDFTAKRAGQTRFAVDEQLNKISPIESAEVAGDLGRKAADKSIEDSIKVRANNARPLYEAAFSVEGIPQEMAAEAAELMKRPAMFEAGMKAKKLAANEGLNLADPKNSLKGMHYMKLALDDMIEGAGVKGSGSTYKRGLVDLKNQLVSMMDEASPDYKQARQIYSHFSPMVKDLKEGPIGRLSELGDEKLVNVAERMFNPRTNGPLAVSQARKAIEKADPEAWQALKRAYIQGEFEKASQQFATSRSPGRAAGQFWAAFGGNARQMSIMKEAMTPGEFQAFKDLQDVLEASSRVTDSNSDTAFKLAAIDDLKSQSGGRVMKSILAPQRISGRLMERLEEVRLGKHSEKLAEIITSPDGMAKLKELKKLSPTDRKWVEGVSTLLGISASPAVAGADDPILPERLYQPQKQ